MNLSNIFFGSTGNIFASFSIIIILILITMMSIRLYLSRRKKAYFSLTVSLFIIIVQYCIFIGIEVWNQDQSTSFISDYSAQLLKVVSFIIINMGIFQLYNPTHKREFFYFYSFIILALIIAFYTYNGVQNLDDSASQNLLFYSIWLEVYLFILIFLCFYLVSPFIGQSIKYHIALVVYFVAHLAHVIGDYIYPFNQAVLSIMENFLPILFYCMLFLFIFDRVVEMLQSVHQSAITDGLTGVFNKNYFLQRVSDFIQSKANVSLIFCDIDNFKILNDTQGHQKGDEVLKNVAKIMKESCEDIGIAGRYGGEELVILLTDPTINDYSFSEKLRKRIELETTVTVSVGLCQYSRGMTAQELIERADQAMYQSKKTGKNKVSKYQVIQS